MKLKEVNIGSLGEVITGNTPLTSDKEFYGGTYQFIKPTDMDIDRRRVTKWAENYSEKAYKKYKNSFIPKGSTGVVTIGTVGEKLFQADEDCFTNQSVNVIVPNEEYDQDFIYYLMKFNLPKVSNANPGTASGRHHVSKSNFCAINVVVPSDKNVQVKIGKILSAYDDLIENNLKRIKLLEELAQRTYEEWFVKFRVNGVQLEVGANGLPDSWEKKKLNDVYSIKYGKNLPQTQIMDDGKYPVYGASGVMGYYQNSNCEQKVVLVTSRGNGSGDIHRTYESAFVTNNSFVVSPKANYGHLNLCFTLEFFKRLNLKSYCSGSAQPQLTNASMHNIDVFIPKMELVLIFNEIADDFIRLPDKLRIQNKLLKESRNILLPRLMSGKIDVEKANEELVQVIPLPAEKTKKASKEFKEAVLISVLTEKFGNEKFPLGRKRYTKLSYLFHRHADNQIADYLRKAAGPYNPKTKYAGPERIAHQNGYVADHKNGNLTGLIAGSNIAAAKTYFENYWNIEYMNWLESQFKYKSNDDLELYATIDSTIIELNKKNLPVTLGNVKEIIKKEPEWEAKLEREIFSDVNINRAISFLPTLFNY